MRELERVAYQLSKITDNVRYDFSDEFYTNLNNPKVGQLERRIEEFFTDAKFLSVTMRKYEFFEKSFTLKFENKDQYLKSLLILESHGFDSIDEDETGISSPGSDNHDYELSFTVSESSAFDFIHGDNQGKISISRLSTLLKSKIVFTFYYGDDFIAGETKEYFGTVQNGIVDFQPQFAFNEIYKVEDISKFSLQLYELIDCVPNENSYKLLKPIIKFE